MSDQPSIGRRRFLSGALATAAAAVAGPSLLAACGSGSSSGANAPQKVDQIKLPTYTPYTGVKPDLPGNEQGLLDGFLNYPTPPIKAINAVPGQGGTVSAFVQTSAPIPPALGSNPYWQELNKRLGVDLQLQIVPNSDMPVKFATLIAGNDLPDMIVPALFTPNGLPSGVANLPAWMAAKCQDLTPYLSGDNIKEYPFLANIPTAAWAMCRYNGGIYGLPVQRGIGGTLMFRRDDIFAKLGVNPQPASFAEFREVCKQLTDEKSNRWALTSAGTAQYFINVMLGVPNNWAVRDGKLVRDYEVEEYKQALSDAAQMVKDGLAHPDSFTSNAPTKQWFESGATVLTTDRYTSWPQYYSESGNPPGFDLGGMRPPKYSGGGFAGTYQAQPTNNFTVLKKADDKRIRQLLTICNWLAAPFGTEEYLFRKFGIEGVDYTMTPAGPSQSQTGYSQTALGIRYIVDSPDVLFVPGIPKATQKCYDYMKSIIPTSVPDPTTGLFSDTWSRKSGQLGTLVNNAINDILSGRKPVSSWDDIVKQWRSLGGDQARGEYEAAMK